MSRHVMHVSACCGSHVDVRYRNLFTAFAPVWALCDECGNPCYVTSFNWYDSVPNPPKPTIRPKLSRNYWFWRFYGWILYRPTGNFIRWFTRCKLVKIPNYEWNRSTWKRRKVYLWAEQLFSKRKRTARWFDRHIRWTMRDYHCHHCGDSAWGDSDELFECVNSGSTATMDGTDYWADGWQFCGRCGYREFVHESSL